MSSEKRKMFMPLLIILVTAKKQLEIGRLIFFIEKLRKFAFETYIVLNKKYEI